MSNWLFVRTFLIGYGAAFVVAMLCLIAGDLSGWSAVKESAPMAWTVVGAGVGASFCAGLRQATPVSPDRDMLAEPGAAPDRRA